MDAFLSQFKTGVKLAAGFGVLIVCLLAVGGYGMSSSRQLGTLLHEMYQGRVGAITVMDEANLLAVRHNRTIFSLAAEQDTLVIDDIKRELHDYEVDFLKRLDAFSNGRELSPREAELNIMMSFPQYMDQWETYCHQFEAKVLAEQNIKLTINFIKISTNTFWE